MTAPLRETTIPTAARRRALLASTSLVAALAAAGAAAQQALPSHGAVASGAASISQSGAALTINQTSSRTVINWNSFSIGAGNSVTFVQPSANAAALNRVTGSTPTSIAGQLDANGQVFLVNPNGVAITRGGAVNVGGGFVAATLAITDRDFNNGDLSFAGGGASAAVSNAGTITAAPGGFVGLLGGSVANSGTINAPIGKVGLGSGEQATLDLTGDGFLQVALPTNAQTADGKALIDMTGAVKAAGGTVAIKAATAANAVRNAINLSGYVSARSAHADGGAIVLDGGAGGNVKVAGKLDASGRKAGGSLTLVGRNVALARAKLAARGAAGKGGEIAVSATHAVSLTAANLDASGATGGGTITIGGSPRGLGPLVDAATTSIDSATVLRADALASGDGGAVTVWSDTSTAFAGLISARGGPGGGDGGSAEVSANAATLGVLNYTGLADLTASKGAAGTLLLDPYDIVISTGTDAGGGFAGGVYAPTSTSVINTTTLETQLAAANVVISTGAAGSAGPDAGNITVSSPVTWSSANGLTLTAANAITINAPISIAGAGQLTLNYSTAADTNLSFGASGNVNYAGGGGISGQALDINGNNYALLFSMSDIANLNGYGAGTYVALAASVTAPTTAYTSNVVASYGGVFEGLGNTIAGLAISETSAPSASGPTTLNYGLFGVLNAGGVIRDVGLTGGSYSILPTSNGSSSAYTYQAGALAGENDGTVVNSYNTNTFSSTDSTGSTIYIGGLVGANYGLVEHSYAVVDPPTVSSLVAGGLVGYNDGTIENSYATGGSFISGPSAIFGGLVGYNDGLVETSYTNITLAAADTGSGQAAIGGLVGVNSATGKIENSYATGAVTGDAGSVVGGLVGSNSGSISDSYSTATVSGAGTLGGLVGVTPTPTASPTAVVTDSYWDTDTSGQTTSAGGTPLTTAQMQSGGTVGFGAPWLGGTGLYPFLDTLFPLGVEAVSGYAYQDAAGTTPAASGVNGAVMVYGSAGAPTTTTATVLTPVATGANGYYYLFASAGAIPAGANVVAYTSVNSTTGATNGATFFVSAGAANNSNTNIIGETVNATTPYPLTSLLLGGLAQVYGSRSAALAFLDSVQYVNVTATGSSFTLDEPLTLPNSLKLSVQTTTAGAPLANTAVGAITLTGGALSLATNGGTTTIGGAVAANTGVTVVGASVLSANVAAANGAVDFKGPVALGASSTVGSSLGTTFEAAVDGSAAPGAGLTVTGPVTLEGSVATANGALAFNGAVTLNGEIAIDSGTATTTFGSTIDAPSFFPEPTYGLDATAGGFSFGGAIGATHALNSVSLTSASAMTLPSISAQTIFAQTTGAGASLTLAPGTTLSASDSGNVVTLVAAGAFINDAGAEAIAFTVPQTVYPLQLSSTTPATWQIYSNNPADDTFGDLNSNNRAIYGATYPASTPTSGDYYLFALQPTLTVTSTSASKTYGQDVTTPIMQDYTITGYQAGVAGAFLGDTTAVAVTGAPSVTSTGSGATAGVASGPYTINVAQGDLTAPGGYQFTFVDTGALTVNPEPITLTATSATKPYDGSTSSTAQPLVTNGTLYDPATLSQTYANAGPGANISLNPAIAFANAAAAGNYAVTLVPTGAAAPNAGVILASTETPQSLLAASPAVVSKPQPPTPQPQEPSTCGVSLQVPQASLAGDAASALSAVTAATSQIVERCRDASQADVANALDSYADALQIVIAKLPPKLRQQLVHIPAVVRSAAVRARAAPTRIAAVRVLTQAVAEVHREIALVRADDPDSARLRNAVSASVSGVLNSAAISLAHAEGI